MARPNDTSRQELDETLRQSRKNMPPHQAAVNATQVTYDNTIGRIPFGAPITLNTEIAANAVNYSTPNNRNTPYVLRPVTDQQRPRVSLGTFKHNKYCVKYGFTRRMHQQLGTSFGNLCSDNCGREERSKCHERLEFHSTPIVIGHYCIKIAHSNSFTNDWYTNN
ncbi:hypothetical protein SEMRO_1713_G292940.1 [Seminavis robusta]|uniref:Uncharacterized protein n=1 Tax=Seminavis robusta TaxID=568900 RepID=A0A9N8ER47_9STRA|nr:hypothetical protein SEMRO_1713_G292940.1 [Seminavis robusta]|eukprot:Sro1713_g292940.1 n/a (165) ;mRNA; f:1695-2189